MTENQNKLERGCRDDFDPPVPYACRTYSWWTMRRITTEEDLMTALLTGLTVYDRDGNARRGEVSK